MHEITHTHIFWIILIIIYIHIIWLDVLNRNARWKSSINPQYSPSHWWVHVLQFPRKKLVKTTDSTLFLQQPGCLNQETWPRPPPHWPISCTAPPLARRIPGSNYGALLPITGTGDFEVALQWIHKKIIHDKNANMLYSRKLKFEKLMVFWLGRSFYEWHRLMWVSTLNWHYLVAIEILWTYDSWCTILFLQNVVIKMKIISWICQDGLMMSLVQPASTSSAIGLTILQ